MKYEGQETAAATCANGQGNLPACAPLANPYVPFQLQNPERYKPGCAIIRGTLFPGLDLPLAGQENTQELRQTALHTLQELGFAINELGLYLDTHRSDSDAVELYNQYVELYGHQLQQVEQPAATVTCTALTLSTNTVTFEEAEQFYGITYTREPADCTEEVVFSSDNESIATVNQQGKIVAVNAGSAVITAKCGTQTASCLVTCDFKVVDEEQPSGDEELSLNNTDMTFFSPGEQFTLAVKGAPEEADITYSSADASVATVSDRGVITAMGSGTTTITVYVGGRDPFSCIVRCNLDSSAEAPDGSYSISHSDVTMSLMGEYFKLRLLDSNGDAVSGVSWSSGDSSICTVDASGVVTAAGSGTTTVSTTYGGSTYQCIVRCNLG